MSECGEFEVTVWCPGGAVAALADAATASPAHAPFAVDTLGLPEVEPHLPFVPDHLAARKAAHGDDHGGGWLRDLVTPGTMPAQNPNHGKLLRGHIEYTCTLERCVRCAHQESVCVCAGVMMRRWRPPPAKLACKLDHSTTTLTWDARIDWPRRNIQNNAQ